MSDRHSNVDSAQARRALLKGTVENNPDVDIISNQPKSVLSPRRASFHRVHPSLSEASGDREKFNIFSGLPANDHKNVTSEVQVKHVKSPVPDAVYGRAISPTKYDPITGTEKAVLRRSGSSSGMIRREQERFGQNLNPITGEEVPAEPIKRTAGTLSMEFRSNGQSGDVITNQVKPTPAQSRTAGTIQKELSENKNINPITGEKVEEQPRRIRSKSSHSRQS